MKTQNILQEILLFTNTSFSKREWCEVNAPKDKMISYSHQEQLERACWNGALTEMFPEIMPSTIRAGRVSLWQVLTRESFVVVEMSEQRQPAEELFSIDPYLFTQVIKSN